MGTILIKNGRLWDGECFSYADVLTEGKAVKEIGKSIGTADFVYDAEGKTVTAGLVDIHVHTTGISSDEFGINAEMSSFPFGVTAISNAGTAFANKALCDSCSVKNTVFVGMGEAAERHLEEYRERAVGVKVYFDTSLNSSVDKGFLMDASTFAVKNDLRVMVHCSNSPISMADTVRLLSRGDIITHIYHGGANSCTENNFEAFRLARDKGVIMDGGFAGFVHTDFKNLAESFKAGYFPDTISTDITRYSAFKRGGRYGMTSCMSLVKDLGMKEENIFKAVTSSPANVLGKGDEWGYLKVGRCADIAVLDYTNEGYDMTDKAGNRVHNTEGYRCILTVSDGEVVYRD